MDAHERSAVQSHLSPAADKALRSLLRYAEGSAGALMDPSVLGVAETLSVAEAMERLARSPQPALYYLYVVAEDQKLVGVQGADPIAEQPSHLRSEPGRQGAGPLSSSSREGFLVVL
jgi:Mg/Co/Ni transporter MgtE